LRLGDQRADLILSSVGIDLEANANGGEAIADLGVCPASATVRQVEVFH